MKVEVTAARPAVGAMDGLLGHAAVVQHLLSSAEKAMSRAQGGAQLRELTIAEARPLLEEAETERLVNSESARARGGPAALLLAARARGRARWIYPTLPYGGMPYSTLYATRR